MHPILATAIAERSSEGLRVYADYLDERGDPMAEGWRLLGESGKWPGEAVEKHYGNNIWWNNGYWRVDATTDLDPKIFAKIGGRIGGSQETVRFFPNELAALTAAARAFAKVRGTVHAL